MVQLKPGATVAAAIATLEATSRTAENVLGAGGTSIELLNAYRQWSSQQIRALSTHLVAATVEDLVITRRYWVLHSLDPIAYGVPALAEFVELEFAESITALNEAVKHLRTRLEEWRRWGWHASITQPGHAAIVLDTNVLMRHSHELLTIDWHEGITLRPHEPISLGIPMTVVEELDRLKLATGEMSFGGKKYARRTLARRALSWLDETFPDQNFSTRLRQGQISQGPPTADLCAVLMIDDLRRDRLTRPDLDILDDAAGLRPFVSEVAVATYDHAMRFRARSLALKAFAPTKDDG